MKKIFFAFIAMLYIVGAQAQVSISVDTTSIGYREFRRIAPSIAISGLDLSTVYTGNWWSSNDGATWVSSNALFLLGNSSTAITTTFCSDTVRPLYYYIDIINSITGDTTTSDTISTFFDFSVDYGFGLRKHQDGGALCQDSVVYWQNIYHGARAEIVTFVTRNFTNQGFAPDWMIDTLELRINGSVVSTGYTKILASNGWENFITWHIQPGTILNDLDTLEIWVGRVLGDGFMWMGIHDIQVEDTATGSTLGPEGCSDMGWIWYKDQWSCPSGGPIGSVDSIYFEFDTINQSETQVLWFSAQMGAEVYMEELSTGNFYLIGYGQGAGIYDQYWMFPSCERETEFLVYIYDSTGGVNIIYKNFVEIKALEFSAHAGTSNVTVNLESFTTDSISVYIDLLEVGPFFNTVYASKIINLQDTTVVFNGLAPQKQFVVSIGYGNGTIYGPTCQDPITTDPCGAGHILEYVNGNLLFSYPSYMAGSIFTVYASGQGSPFILEVATPATATGSYLPGMEVLSVALPIGNATFDLLSPCGDSETYHATVGVDLIKGETVSTVSVYPNPATSWVTIETESLDVDYRVTDVAGRVLMGGSVTDNVIKIDVTSLPAGMYLISVGQETKKLIKL